MTDDDEKEIRARGFDILDLPVNDSISTLDLIRHVDHAFSVEQRARLKAQERLKNVRKALE
jgi:hypothetical protein